MEHSQLLERETRRNCSTWNTALPLPEFILVPTFAVVPAGANQVGYFLLRKTRDHSRPRIAIDRSFKSYLRRRCSTWNTADRRLTLEYPLREEGQLRQVATATSGALFVPTRRRRRRECGTWIGSRQLQVAIF